MITLNNKIFILNINFIKNRLNTVVISTLKLTLVHTLTAWLLYHKKFQKAASIKSRAYIHYVRCPAGLSVLVLATLIPTFGFTLVRSIWIHVQYIAVGAVVASL